MTDNNYNLIGSAYSPFNEKYNRQSQYLLEGIIFDVAMNTCDINKKKKGIAFVKVNWELFDQKIKNITLTFSSEGVAMVDSFSNIGGDFLIEKAFSMAVDNMLANQKFYD